MPRFSQLFTALMASLFLFACGAPPEEEKQAGDPIPAGVATVQTAHATVSVPSHRCAGKPIPNSTDEVPERVTPEGVAS